MPTTDIVVVGAGLTGLTAAKLCAVFGNSVTLLEAEPDVGGRVRSRTHDGFILDRGFQLINPAYPALKRHADLDKLDLHPFYSAALLRRDGATGKSTALVAHPGFHPQYLPRTLRSGVVRPKDISALSAWLAAAPRDDISAAQDWDNRGITGPVRTEFLEPFLAGVVAEDMLETTSGHVRFLIRSFLRARPALPSTGVGMLSQQMMANAKRAGVDVLTNTQVTAVRESGNTVTVETNGDIFTASKVIVAVDAQSRADLVDKQSPAMNGLTTWWFAADQAPTDKPIIALDATKSGPLVNSAVITNAVPSYSSQGQALIQASALLTPGAAVTDTDALKHAEHIWQTSTAGWELVARDDIEAALPQHTPATSVVPRSAGRIVFAGDDTYSPSINGAIESGEKAAAVALDK